MHCGTILNLFASVEKGVFIIGDISCTNAGTPLLIMDVGLNVPLIAVLYTLPYSTLNLVAQWVTYSSPTDQVFGAINDLKLEVVCQYDINLDTCFFSHS